MLLLPASSTEMIPSRIRAQLPAGDAFEQIMALQGDIYRDMPGRLTIRLSLGGQSYFIKQHFGVGWSEIFKNLISLRLPVVSAMTEVRAIQKLNQLAIPTTPLVAFACRGHSPASMRSFVMTQDLGDIVSLETLCADWKKNPPDLRFKRRLIVAAAKLARTLHDHGMNHRDFYICHLCLDKQRLVADEIHLYLIDLHRVGIRPKISPSDRMKDIAGLYFSSLNIGLSKRDFLRFLSVYCGNLHDVMAKDSGFWERVQQRARKLYYKFHAGWPISPFD